MTTIKTWNQRCEEHPDHQDRIVTHSMIDARKQEEIDELRADNTHLRNSLEGEQVSIAKLTAERDELRAKLALIEGAKP